MVSEWVDQPCGFLRVYTLGQKDSFFPNQLPSRDWPRLSPSVEVAFRPTPQDYQTLATDIRYAKCSRRYNIGYRDVGSSAGGIRVRRDLIRKFRDRVGWPVPTPGNVPANRGTPCSFSIELCACETRLQCGVPYSSPCKLRHEGERMSLEIFE